MLIIFLNQKFQYKYVNVLSCWRFFMLLVYQKRTRSEVNVFSTKRSLFCIVWRSRVIKMFALLFLRTVPQNPGHRRFPRISRLPLPSKIPGPRISSPRREQSGQSRHSSGKTAAHCEKNDFFVSKPNISLLRGPIFINFFVY